MSNTLIIILGLAGAALLLGGVGFSAYSRIKRMGQSGMRLGDLLDRLEESLEEEDAWKLAPDKKHAKTQDGSEKNGGQNRQSSKEETTKEE